MAQKMGNGATQPGALNWNASDLWKSTWPSYPGSLPGSRVGKKHPADSVVISRALCRWGLRRANLKEGKSTKREKKSWPSFSSASQTLANGLFLSEGPFPLLSTLDPRIPRDRVVTHIHALVGSIRLLKASTWGGG